MEKLAKNRCAINKYTSQQTKSLQPPAIHTQTTLNAAKVLKKTPGRSTGSSVSRQTP